MQKVHYSTFNTVSLLSFTCTVLGFVGAEGVRAGGGRGVRAQGCAGNRAVRYQARARGGAVHQCASGADPDEGQLCSSGGRHSHKGELLSILWARTH